MKNITAKQESRSNWREEMNEAKVDDVKYGKGNSEKKQKDQSKDVHLLQKNSGVRQDRNKRRSAADVIFHGHSKVERERKQEHYKNRGVKTKGKKVNEDVYSTVKKVLDAGSKFVETNPVGKALGNVVKPFNSTDGGSNRKSPTKKSQQEIIDKNLNKEEVDTYNKVMYDKNGKEIDPNSDEWYKFPVYDKNGKLINKKDSPTEAAKTVNAEGKSYGITKGDGMSFPERLKKKKNDKKADKDYDGDGKVESSKDEYFGSKDKAIKKAMEEEIEGGVSVETYTKDTKFMEIETLDVITAEPLRSDWRSDLKEGAIETITNWLKLTKDPKNHEVSDKTMTGKAITGLQKRDKANQEAMKLLNQSYSWRKDLGILDEGGK